MGLIVLFMSAPVLLPLIIIAMVLGLKGDEWFNHAPPRRNRHYIDIIDEGDYSGLYADDSDFSDIVHEDYNDDGGYSDYGDELYGGLPYGDGEIFLVDGEDYMDEYLDSVL